jgi:hypothetical protein
MHGIIICDTKEKYIKLLQNKKYKNIKNFIPSDWDIYKEDTLFEIKNNFFEAYGKKEHWKGRCIYLYTFREWVTLNNDKQEKEKGMKQLMLDVLNKTYDNPILRRKTVPLFMSDPGLGKTTIIKEFAEEKGVNMVKITLSQRMPNEVVGGVMPNKDTRSWEVYDSFELSRIKDGDILFFDEVFNGTLKQTLDAVLNLLEDRMLPSGKKLADVMIVAASNPQGLINLTPQIKERFIRYDLKFDKKEFQDYLKKKYGMPEEISNNLCILVTKEKFEAIDWGYMSPRSIEKTINQIGCDLEAPNQDLILPYLMQKISSPMDIESIEIKQGDEVEYLQLLKLIIKHYNATENQKQAGRVAAHISS